MTVLRKILPAALVAAAAVGPVLGADTQPAKEAPVVRRVEDPVTTVAQPKEAFALGLKAKRPADKIRWYTRTIELAPKMVEAYNNRGSAYFYSGKYDEAIGDYTRAISMDPNRPQSYCNRGGAYLRKGEYDRAIQDCTRAVELDPKLAQAYDNRALAYRKKGDEKQAIRDYTKAIAVAPRFARAYECRGGCHYALGDYDRAIADFTQALRLEPARAQTYDFRGRAYYRKDDCERAIYDFTTAIERDPNMAEAYSNRGLALARKGLYDRAIQDHTKAMELGSTGRPERLWRGWAFFNDRRFAEAVPDFAHHVKRMPKDPYGHLGLYLARTRAGKGGKADLAAFRKRQGPGKDDEWPTPVVRMYLGEITPQQCLAAAVDEVPKRDAQEKSEACYYIGLIYLLRGDRRTARRCFRWCLAAKQWDLVEYTGAQAELRWIDEQAVQHP